MQDSIERTTHIPVDIETVWEALTTAEGIRRWFGDEAEIDLRPGGGSLRLDRIRFILSCNRGGRRPSETLLVSMDRRRR
jgi:uncharacterized protein YndB with AHSA1/START domain